MARIEIKPGDGRWWSQKLRSALNSMFTELYSFITELFVRTSVTVKQTPEGGTAVLLINDTGAPTVKGELVTPSSTDGAVELVTIGIPNAVGVFYEAGIADGESVWVVISGIADVLFSSATTTSGQFARSPLAIDIGEANGQAIAENLPATPFATDKHFCEIGHIMETIAAPGLARCTLHFN